MTSDPLRRSSLSYTRSMAHALLIAINPGSVHPSLDDHSDQRV